MKQNKTLREPTVSVKPDKRHCCILMRSNDQKTNIATDLMTAAILAFLKLDVTTIFVHKGSFKVCKTSQL